MTLAAPRSRRGKGILVLAILALVLAAAWILLGQSPGSVYAVHNNNYANREVLTGDSFSVTHDNIGATVETNESATCRAPLTTVWYDWTPTQDSLVQMSTAGGSTDFDTVIAVFTGDPDMSQPGWLGGTGTWAEVACNDDAFPDFSSLVTLRVTAGTTYHIMLYGFAGETGTFTLQTLVSVAPPDASNPEGTPHTVTFNLQAGVTCQNDAVINNQVDCAPADVVVGGPCTLSAGPTVGDPDTADASTVTVTINGAAAGASCTVALDTKFVGPIEGTTLFDIAPITANKSFVPLAVLRHHDIADPASEDAAGTVDERACEVNDATSQGNGPPPTTEACGLLAEQDDIDDAIGSFHGACIIPAAGLDLTTATIEWHIEPVAGGPIPAAVTEYTHPLGYPCVRWSAATTGTQQIFATVTFPPVATPSPSPSPTLVLSPLGLPTPTPPPPVGTFTIWFDASVPLPLIKEWNDIDRTIIIAADGNVGETLELNTGDLDDWFNRDCSFIPEEPTGFGFCDNPNLDGQTVTVGGVLIPGSGLINANGRSFIDYTFGSHSDAGGVYSGPVDGAEQTYTISGVCGSVRIEDPFTGDVIIISNSGPFSDEATVLSSDKGVGFQIVPNDSGEIGTTPVTADCAPFEDICVTIHTEEANLFRSPPLIVLEPDEEICVEFVVGPPTNKTPVLAWAGQRVVVEHDWADYSSGERECPFGFVDLVSGQGKNGSFGVQYTKQAGPGSFTSALVGNGFNNVDITGEDVIVEVDPEAQDDFGDGQTDANSDCISRVIYESQDQGQVDITAFPVDPDDDLPTADPIGQQVSFVIYYMKFEDANLGIVPELSGFHLPRESDVGGNFPGTLPSVPATDVFNNSDDETEGEFNVSSDVLLRVRVRGWVLTDNCPARESRTGQNGEFIPANRCIFPDDWAFKAGCPRPADTNDFTGPGGVGGTLVPQPWENCQLARDLRPNFDTLWGPGEVALDYRAVC